MLVIPPLPHGNARCPPQRIHPPPRHRLKPPHHLQQPTSGGLHLLRRGGSPTRPSSDRHVCPGLPRSAAFQSLFLRQRTIFQYNHPMHVIRHHHKRIQRDVPVIRRQPIPHGFHKTTGGIHVHRAVGNVSKQKRPTMRTNRHRISARLRIVAVTQPQPPTLWPTSALVPGTHPKPFPTARPCIPSPQSLPHPAVSPRLS